MVFSLLFLTAGCDNPPSENQSAKPVLVMTVAAVKSSEVRILSGLVTPRRSATLGFQAAGQIRARLIDVGTRVRQGQPLMVLDTDDYAQSQLAAEDQVAAARAEMKQSVADAQRLIALIDKGAVGKAEMERQQARADALEAILDQANRRLEIARNKLAYASLNAPFDGVVTSVRAEVGQVIAEAEPVLSIAQDDVLEVSVDIPQDLAVLVDLPQTIFQGRLHGASGIGLQLQLREYSPAATAPLRTFRAVFTILNPQGIHHHLRIGMTAEVMLSIAEQKEGQTILPASALISTGKDVSVWVLEPGQKSLRKRLVGVTRSGDGGVIVEGLRPGEQVVVAGTDKLTTEMIVRPLERTGTAYLSGIQ
jgi:membrane fusion protein, multidrug efflux system